MTSNILISDPVLLGKSQTSIPFFHSPITPASTKSSSHKRQILNHMSDFSPSNQGSFPFGSPNSTTSSINNSPPMKRKRGRPPKADSLTNRITSTMNISVNTSPLSNSPTAESNSNQITRRNNPDYYTSILKVSPTSKTPTQKKKRKSSHGLPSHQRQNSTGDFSNLSSPTDLSPNKKSKSNNHISRQGDNLFVTPLSAAINGSTFTPYHQINSKTLDNISFITQSNSTSSNSSFNQYNTPPSSTVKPQFDNGANQLYSPTPKADNAQAALANGFNANNIVNPSILLGHGEFEMNKNLLPPVSIVSNTVTIDEVASKQQTKSNPAEKKRKSPKISRDPSPKTVQKVEKVLEDEKPKESATNTQFQLKLTVDDSGKAVLSNDFFQSLTGSQVKKEEVKTTTQSIDTSKRSITPEPKVNENEYTTNSREQSFKPRLTHANSVIGIETQHFPELAFKSENEASVDFNQDQSKYSQQQLQGVFPPQGNALRRHNSDFTGLNIGGGFNASSSLIPITEGMDEYSQANNLPQLPQTPKIKDNFLLASTGLTPSLMIANNNLTFNLTPQFNSMMYSMMNINSPQLKRNFNHSQFLLNQDFFMNLAAPNSNSNNQNTINMTDLLSLGNNAAHAKLENSDRILQDKIEQPEMAQVSSSSSNSNDESGDARLALKKIIHVKRR